MLLRSAVRSLSQRRCSSSILRITSSSTLGKVDLTITSNRHYSGVATLSKPRILRGGKVQWENRKGSRSFGLALDATPEITKPFPKAVEAFPGAVTNSELVEKICSTLEGAGYDIETTLVATSFCVDEVSRPLELELANKFTYNFNMGGLSGFPFAGATGFGAMASHIPDGGSCLVVHGPHVGVDTTGKVGTVERRGRENGGACCGSAQAALAYVSSVHSGEMEEATSVDDPLDAQQSFVGKMLLPYAERLEKADDKMFELPKSIYDAQADLMGRIVGQSASAVADGKIAVLGGIQVNTPPGFTDYYQPLSFKLYNNSGELLEELW